jgi:hypothetical protein
MSDATFADYTEDDVVDWLGEPEVAKARPYVDLVHDPRDRRRPISATVPGSARQPYAVLSRCAKPPAASP